MNCIIVQNRLSEMCITCCKLKLSTNCHRADFIPTKIQRQYINKEYSNGFKKICKSPDVKLQKFVCLLNLYTVQKQTNKQKKMYIYKISFCKVSEICSYTKESDKIILILQKKSNNSCWSDIKSSRHFSFLKKFLVTLQIF